MTSVDVASQTARTLATNANTVRAIDAVTNKPETASTVTIAATAMKQVATVQSGIPNVYLESQAISRIVEQDRRLSLNDGLDSLVVAAFAASGFQAPGTDNPLVSSPGQFSSNTFFGMTRRVSKTVAAPVVADSQAFGTV